MARGRPHAVASWRGPTMGRLMGGRGRRSADLLDASERPEADRRQRRPAAGAT